MTGRIAIFLALLVTLAVAADLWAQGGAGLLFLARKGIDLIQYLTFWR